MPHRQSAVTQQNIFEASDNKLVLYCQQNATHL